MVSLFRQNLPHFSLRCIEIMFQIASYRTLLIGGAEELISVQIQRNGKAMNYRVEEPIPVQLIWFKADGKLFDNMKTQVRHLASRRPVVDARVSVITI